MYENKDTGLSVAPVQIVVENRTYHLFSALLCNIQKEDGNYVIENAMLNLYAVGANIDDAEHDLYREFDEAYKLLNSFKDEGLSDNLLRAKNMINLFVKEIVNE